MKIISFITKLKKKLSLYFASEVDESTISALLDIVAVNFEKKYRIINNKYFMFPSELSKCLKSTFYKYINENLLFGISPSTKSGTIIDFGIEYAIKKFQSKNKKVFLIHKFPIKFTKKIDNDEIIITGSVDFVSKNAIIEIKSTMDKELKINQSDINQLSFYTKVLNMEFNTEFDAYLIYIYRNMFLKRIYKLKKEEIETGFKIILDRALLLYKHLKDRLEPEAEPGPWCSGCPIIKQCHSGKDYIKKVLNKDIDYIYEKIIKDQIDLMEAYKKIFGKFPY